MASDPKISIRNLYKIFGSNDKDQLTKVKEGMTKTELLEKESHVLGLNNINIDIEPQTMQVIMGLSGSGKSTLIRHINRLIEPTEGEIIIDGRDILSFNKAELQSFRRFGASMVFQKFALLPHRTVLENVIYGLKIQGVAKVEAKKRACYWLERVGLTSMDNHYPAQLSGGMQQRVGLARALATDAEILLMDEAFSALDPLIRTDMQSVLLELQSELHKTIVFITHDLDEALHIGDDIAILRDGELIQRGTPQSIVLKPADSYVADFTKDINRARVLTLATLSNSSTENTGLPLDASLTLEEAMGALVKSKETSVSVIRNGSAIGRVTLDDMVTAISRPKASNSDETYR